MNPSPSPRPASPSPAWRRGNRPAHLIVAGALLAIALVAAAVVLGRAPGPPPVESSSAVERTMGYGDARDPTSFQPVAVGQLGAQQIVVAGGRKLLGETFELYRWDLATGASIGQPLTGHTDYIAALTIAHIDDRPIIVSGGYDGEVRRWDLATGTPVGQPIAVRSRDDEGHVPAPCSLAAAQLDGRSLIVVADTNRDVRVWDLASGAPLGQRIAADAVVVAATQLDGRPVVLTGGRDGVVRMWDPTTGVPVGRPLSLDTGTVDVPAENRLDPRHVSSVAVALLHGRPVIVAAGWRLVDGDADAIVRVWDVATGGQVGQPLVTADAIDSVAVTEFRGRPVVVVGGSGVLRVSDVATGALLGRSLAVPGQDFDALATAQLDNQPAIVSANTFEIRTRDLATRFS